MSLPAALLPLTDQKGLLMTSEPAPAPESSEPSDPTIHAAERASGPSGAVEWGEERTEEQAVQRRKKGLDIVVRGANQRRNREKARAIEAAVGGPIVHNEPHARAGRFSLPHFHQASRDPEGHSFYELGNRKARRKQ